MGLVVSVYKFPMGDCTNNGISKGVDSLCLVNVSGPSQPSADQPAAMLIRGALNTVKIVPAHGVVSDQKSPVWIADPRWCMMGGNFAHTSDSRFSEACSQLLGHRGHGAIAIHDRIEV